MNLSRDFSAKNKRILKALRSRQPYALLCGDGSSSALRNPDNIQECWFAIPDQKAPLFSLLELAGLSSTRPITSFEQIQKELRITQVPVVTLHVNSGFFSRQRLIHHLIELLKPGDLEIHRLPLLLLSEDGHTAVIESRPNDHPSPPFSQVRVTSELFGFTVRGYEAFGTAYAPSFYYHGLAQFLSLRPVFDHAKHLIKSGDTDSHDHSEDKAFCLSCLR